MGCIGVFLTDIFEKTKIEEYYEIQFKLQRVGNQDVGYGQ